MKIEQQNIAIAESLGWTQCQHVSQINLVKGYPPVNNPPKYGTYENGMAQLPNYTQDLDAIHAAVKTLLFSQRQAYRKQLQLVMSNHNESTMVAMTECIDATAEQRSEAYLRALGLWQD